ncbi:hypothetical protein L6452_03539 [Arctium lappa]|uniref:Uncharacterized protein n=1 Tax=Arctium lappa TaxID=4217 RepID=A0ACB9FND5_ARCLA|nr:hypothetical protein L6452_03539 [Arctium lappa]
MAFSSLYLSCTGMLSHIDHLCSVSSEAEHCLTVVLSQYDSFRCSSVIVPLLATEDEKTLVTCINCLTKAVGTR